MPESVGLPRLLVPRSGVSILEASKSAWNGGSRAGNGALMRCAPLAVRWGERSRKRLVRESVISAVPTHWDYRCGWSCVLANLAAAAALTGKVLSAGELRKLAEDGVAAALPEIEQYGYGPTMPSSVAKALDAAWSSELHDVRFDGANKGFTLLTLQAVLISLWNAEDFETGMSAVIERGGDTDTNGAAVGAVLGARFGLAGLPDRWRARVAEIRAGRVPMSAHADALLEAAWAG